MKIKTNFLSRIRTYQSLKGLTTCSFTGLHLVPHADRSELFRDLNLPKNQCELLAFRLEYPRTKSRRDIFVSKVLKHIYIH